MSFVKYPPTNIAEAIDVIEQDSEILHNIVHGDENTEVLTENGLVPSVDKVLNDINTQADNVLAGIQADADAAIASTGWMPAGEFTTGFTFTARNQIGFDASGNTWSYNGSLPFTVPAGTIPSEPTYTNRGDAALRSALAAPDSTVLVGGVEAGELGYAGDLRRFLNRATNDHQQALNDALEYCRNENKTLFLPAGEWHFEEQTAAGGMVNILGEGQIATRLNMNLPAGSSYLFNFTSNGGANRSVSNFSIQGSGQYSTKDNFLIMPNAYATSFSKIRALNMGRVFNLTNAWHSHLSNMLIQFTQNPIRMTIPNGSTLEKIYIQRFKGDGINLEAGLATKLSSIIMEYGQDDVGNPGGIGLLLRGMESYSIDGYYTEGGMSTEILLTHKNQKACMNGAINNYWSNSNPNTNKKIHAQCVRGLSVTNVTTIVPSIPLLNFTGRSFSDGLVDVGKVTQIDPNANGFIGQERGVGQVLQPISTDNTLVRMIDYSPKTGNGTVDDLQNIAPHTQIDANGRYPYSAFVPQPTVASVPDGLTCTSSTTQNVFGAKSSGISLSSRTNQLALISVTGDMVSSAGSPTSSAFRLTNETTGQVITTPVRNIGASGTVTTQALPVNVAPGINKITLAITRAQGGGGSNTFTVSDFVIAQP